MAISAGEGILLRKDAVISTDSRTPNIYLHVKEWGWLKEKVAPRQRYKLKISKKFKKFFCPGYVMVMDEVPLELVVNWDQTGLKYVPVSEGTMAEEGSKREFMGKMINIK